METSNQAQKLYESAIAKAPRIKEQNVIRKEMSSIEESLTKVVPSPRLKRKSAIIGGPFKRHILTGKVIKIGHSRHDNLAKIQSFSVEFENEEVFRGQGLPMPTKLSLPYHSLITSTLTIKLIYYYEVQGRIGTDGVPHFHRVTSP